MAPVIVVKGELIIRRFECPFCGYVHVFSPKGKSSHKKRIIGFTCPSCGKKPTEDDFNKKKGKGPKPKEVRRKRGIKKEIIKEEPKAVNPQPHIEQYEWKTREPLPPGEYRNRRYGTGRKGWGPKPLQPMDRSFGEAVMSSLNIRPSAPIPHQNLRSEEKLENKEYRKIDIEKLEKHEKKLALIIVRLDRVEERLDSTVKKLDIRLTELDSKLQSLSTLTSHMGMILDAAERKMPRIQGYNRGGSR